MTRGRRCRRVVQIRLSDARRSFIGRISRVGYGNERIVLTRHGKGCAVLVPVADAELLQRLEDEADLEIVRERLAGGDVSDYVPHDQVVADLSE